MVKADKIKACLPFYLKGPVVKGFGRGSKDLGIPTANFPESVVESIPQDISTGVYYGWAQVDQGPVHKMVMSIGWNPFYSNQKKSAETHILHEFDSDFYNSTLSVIITGYWREERNYDSLEALIDDINNDIKVAKQMLDTEAHSVYKTDSFFTPPKL